MRVSIATPRLRDRIAAWLLASAWRGLLVNYFFLINIEKLYYFAVIKLANNTALFNLKILLN
jgi:hypothetical protein